MYDDEVLQVGLHVWLRVRLTGSHATVLGLDIEEV